MEIIKRRVSTNLKYYRNLKGLTQEKLAEKIAVSPIYISYLERGLKIPSLTILAKISAALNIDPSLLLIPDNNSKSMEIRKLTLIASSLEKPTIQLINEMITAFIRFKSS